MLQVPLSGIKKIEQQVKATPDCISLSQGALRTGGIPTAIKQHIQTLLNTDISDYYGDNWGLLALRQEIIKQAQRRYNTELPLDSVLITHGCIGGLSLLFLSLLNTDDEVIIPEPSYPAYATLTIASRAKPVYVSMIHNNEYYLDIESIKASATAKTKIIVFSNPCNPLGIVVPKATIIELLAWCEMRGIYLIIDEAYAAYLFTQNQLGSAVDLIPTSPHLFVAHSFSKDFAMSGWRVGYLLGEPTVMSSLARTQDALLNSLNNLAHHAALYALQHPELQEPFKKIIASNAEYSMQQLVPLFDKKIISTQAPAGGFFLFLKTNLDDATPLSGDLLTKARVSLVPGSSFGPSGKSFLRLCFARNRDVLDEGLRRLKSYLLTSY